MIPILFSETEIAFNTNGIGRLYECISVKVYEERNGIYECDFEYPTTGLHYQDIKIGRIIGVTHNLSDDIQPFDIVSYTRPINGVVSFHCVHISYRQNYMTLTCTGIQNLESALLKLPEAQPSNRFNYWTDKSSFGYLGASDGLPHTVRQILGGMQGSILDAYGGEYEWDKWNVNLYSSRGQLRDFSIRYGVNMLNYEEEYSIQETYSSCIPFWTDGTVKVVGNRIESNGVTITQRGECVPLDLSDKFQEEPTQQELEAMAFNYMNRNDAFVPVQNIRVEFARIQDFGEYTDYQNLLDCNLCDTINVFFPDLNSSAQFKIVKTVWDVLRDRYESMELGDLSVTLAEALGITQGTEKPSGAADFVTEQGTSGIWTYRKWNSGVAECWGIYSHSFTGMTAWGSLYYSTPSSTVNFPTNLFVSAPTTEISRSGGVEGWAGINTVEASRLFGMYLIRPTTNDPATTQFHIYARGKWK